MSSQEALVNLLDDLITNDTTLNSSQIINLVNLYFEDDLKNNKNDSPYESYTNCYPCSGCSTHFNYEHSLHLHLERRSYLITLKCLKCDTTKKFFNKCKLLYHIYSHKQHFNEFIFKELRIEVLPIDKLNFNKEKLFLDNFATDSIQIKRACLSDLSLIEDFLVKLAKHDNKVYKCLICEALFFSLNDLIKHNQLDDELKIRLLSIESDFKDEKKHLDNESLNRIDVKKLKFVPKCNLLASLNLSQSNFDLFGDSEDLPLPYNPLICPICGLGLEPSKGTSYFRQHLISECNYAIKYGKIKCIHKDCDEIYSDHRIGYDHWAEKHIREVKLCSFCDIQLDEDEINEHFETCHSTYAKSEWKTKPKWYCDCTPGCSFDVYKFCRKHYSQKILIGSDYVHCYLCEKQIHYDRYKQHFLQVHKISCIVVCYECGLVKE